MGRVLIRTNVWPGASQGSGHHEDAPPHERTALTGQGRDAMSGDMHVSAMAVAKPLSGARETTTGCYQIRVDRPAL